MSNVVITPAKRGWVFKEWTVGGILYISAENTQERMKIPALAVTTPEDNQSVVGAREWVANECLRYEKDGIRYPNA